MSHSSDPTLTPLVQIDGMEAMKNMRENANCNWPKRNNEDNRVEPLAKPSFEVGFRIDPGAKIFTIGSCFARNVEFALIDHGFRVPSQQLENLAGTPPSVLNLHTTPSMFNELNWALNPDAHFDPDIHLYKVGDKYADLHLGPQWALPTTLENALERRKMIASVYAELTTAKVFIATFGYVEVWYDTQLGLYLNNAPLKSLMKLHPGRFVLRVLRQAEVLHYLRKCQTLLQTYGQPDLQCLFTVSPVPLNRTMRPDVDVMVANTYSKSTLRSAVEELCMDHANIHYFPSYESITLSDRAQAWEDDQIHVTSKIVDLNVGRMVNAYLDSDGSTSQGETLRQAREMGHGGDLDGAWTLVEGVLDGDPTSTKAVELGAWIWNRHGTRRDAAQFLKRFGHDVAGYGFKTVTQLTRIAIRAGNFEVAKNLAARVQQMRLGQSTSFLLKGDVCVAMDDFEAARTAYEAAISISRRSSIPYFKLARVNANSGDAVAARHNLELALAIDPDTPRYIELLERLAAD